MNSLRRSDCFHVGSSRKLERKRNRKDGSNFRVTPRSKTLATQKQKVLLLKFFANRNFKSFQGLLVNRYKYEYAEKDTSTVNCVGPHETVLATALSRLSEYPAYY